MPVSKQDILCVAEKAVKQYWNSCQVRKIFIDATWTTSNAIQPGLEQSFLYYKRVLIIKARGRSL